MADASYESPPPADMDDELDGLIDVGGGEKDDEQKIDIGA